MCIKLLVADKKVNIPEYQFFLRGGIVIDKDLQPKNNIDWLMTEPEKWDNITELDRLDNFHGII
jgi:dynein heavy chain